MFIDRGYRFDHSRAERNSGISLRSAELTGTTAIDIAPLRGSLASCLQLIVITSLHKYAAIGCSLLIIIAGATTVVAQSRTYPKEIRGYKVERTVVEIKKPEQTNEKSGNSNTQPANDGANQTEKSADPDSDVDSLIKLGQPQLARVTPLGITFEVPIVVSPVKQSGHVDFLVFEDMVVNGTSVDIDEYHHAYDLPNKQLLTLHQPLRFYIYLPSAVLAALGEWSGSKETWPVTGRVYVFGKFKKGLLSFKRVVPVELNLTIRNPLKKR